MQSPRPSHQVVQCTRVLLFPVLQDLATRSASAAAERAGVQVLGWICVQAFVRCAVFPLTEWMIAAHDGKSLPQRWFRALWFDFVVSSLSGD